ncbi:MAG: DMT family transporter [Candidatus Obscuribacterales bacterium]|nr:DMT family transporter [Candidatus Obscuribacterales bacterium]
MLLPLLAVLGSIISLCVGSSYAKQLFSHIGSDGTTVIRIVFAAVMLVCIWRPWRLPLDRKQAAYIALYGLTLGCMNLMFYKGIAKIPIGIAIAIEFIGPLTLATFSSRRILDFVWIVLAAIGLLLLSPLAGSASTSLDPGGVFCILIAAVLWAVYIIVGKKAGQGHGGQVTSLGFVMASLVVLPFGAQHAYKAMFEPSYVLVGCMVALLSSAIPYSLEMYALQKIPNQTFGILLSMEPAVGALTGWIILGEMLASLQWLAIGCIVAASIGCSFTAKKAEDGPLAVAEGIAPALE